MKKAALSVVKDDLSRHLRLAEKEDVVITRHGRPVALLIDFQTEDDSIDYGLEHDPRFLDRIDAVSRKGRGIRVEDV